MGLVNYNIVMEDSGEDRRVVRVARRKSCNPTTKEMTELEKKRLLDIFNEESD